MAKVFKTSSTNADARAQQVINSAKTAGRQRKSSFVNSIWKDGMTLAITGSDFVFDENELTEALRTNPGADVDKVAESLRTYPVLLVSIVASDGTKTPYNPLWLKTLVAPVDDANGDEHVPAGTFNVLAQNAFTNANTDEEALQAIVTSLAGRNIKCKRATKYPEEYFGRTRTRKLCEFDIA